MKLPAPIPYSVDPNALHISPEMQYIWVSLVTAGALLLYRLLSYDVRRAWLKYGLREPLGKGDNQHFDRLHRIQVNTLEHMAFFLPSLWLCAVYFCTPAAGWLGLIWLAGRTWYAVGYFNYPTRPPYGFHFALAAAILLFLGGAGGVVYKLPLHPLETVSTPAPAKAGHK